MRRIHYQGSLDFTACGRRIIDYLDQATGFNADRGSVTDKPREVTCRRCLNTSPSEIER